MILDTFIEKVSKTIKRKKKLKAAQKFAAKAVNTIEDIKDAVVKKSDAVKSSAAQAAQGVRNAIQHAHGKTAGVKKEMNHGCYEIKKDVRKTARNISNALKNL